MPADVALRRELGLQVDQLVLELGESGLARLLVALEAGVPIGVDVLELDGAGPDLEQSADVVDTCAGHTAPYPPTHAGQPREATASIGSGRGPARAAARASHAGQVREGRPPAREVPRRPPPRAAV